MPALLLGLAPKEPTWIDWFLGPLADPRQTAEIQLKVALGMLALLLAGLAWRSLERKPELADDERVRTWANRVITGVLVVVALCTSISYFYGTRNNGVYVHRWDAFHTVIGAKYHTELGYFDLYKCSYAIDYEGPHHFRHVVEIRDLHTRKFVHKYDHIRGNDCKERFTPERLEEFRADLDAFGKFSVPQVWRRLMMDKGFNGTPFYATVCKALISTIEVSISDLQKLAAIDPILMLIAFGFIWWAYGPRTAAITAIFFCCFFPNRYTHMGGSILRFDYVAASMIGIAAIKKDKWGLAGGMFAWATMERIFPAIFVVGIGLKIAVDVLERWLRGPEGWRSGLAGLGRSVRPEHWRFVGWYAGVVALCFVISLVGMDGGFDNWRTWYHNMKIHNMRSASFRVGFKHLFMLDGKPLGANYHHKQKLFHARENYYWVTVIVLLAPLVAAVRRLDTASFAALFGCFGFFLLAVATRYYYGIFAIVFLVDRDLLKNRFVMLMGAVLFLSTACDFAYWKLSQNDMFMYNNVIGLQLAFTIVVVGVCLVINPALLDVGEDPRLPARVPAALGAKVEAFEGAWIVRSAAETDPSLSSSSMSLAQVELGSEEIGPSASTSSGEIPPRRSEDAAETPSADKPEDEPEPDT